MKRLMFYSKKKIPVISVRKEAVKQNGVIILLFIMFICGLVTGISMYINAESEKQLLSMLVLKFVSQSPMTWFVSNLLLSFLVLFFVLLTGVSGSGIPFVLSAPFICGLADGIISSYLIINHASKGFGFYSLTIAPPACLCIVSVVYLCEICFNSSGKVFKCIFCDSREGINASNLLVSFGMSLFGAVLSCTTGLVLKLIFGEIFNLR